MGAHPSTFTDPFGKIPNQLGQLHPVSQTKWGFEIFQG